MKELEIEQLWYTWSSVGLSGATAGYRIRAASVGLGSAGESRTRSLDRYLRYQLPLGINANTIDPATAPICLALVDHSPGERILAHKVLVGRDAVGRPGVFFAHLLAGLPPDFTARDAIELWHSSLWQLKDVPLEIQSTNLPSFPYNVLLNTRMSQPPSTFDFSSLRDAFLCLIKHYLTLKSQQETRQFYIVGHSEQSAGLIWGLTHCLPQCLFADLTFSTYEAGIEKSRETIVGTTDLQSVLSAPGKEKIIIDCNAPVSSVRAQQDIEEFAAFAVKCLAQPDSQSPDSVALHELVAKAEQLYNRITNVAEFLAFFKTFISQRQQKELVDTFVESIRRGDLTQTLSLREKLSRLAPPATNPELWSDLLQTLSQDELLRPQVMQQWELHKWVLSNIAQVKPLPRNDDIISPWLITEWNNLSELLSLPLPENWKRRVVRRIISSSIAQQLPPSLLHGLVINNMSVFAYVLQQLFNKGEEYQQRALQFLKLLVAQKYQYMEHLLSDIRRLGIPPSVDAQLQTLLPPLSVSLPASSKNVVPPQREERYPAPSQQSSPPISVPPSQQVLVASSSVPVRPSYPLVQHVEPNFEKKSPTWRSPRNIALVGIALILLILSNFSTYYFTSVNDKALFHMQATAQAQATIQAENGADAYSVITNTAPSTVVVNQPFSFYLLLKNTGKSTWSDARGYTIQCVVVDKNNNITKGTDSDCIGGPMVQGFMGNTVLPGQGYAFFVTLHPTVIPNHDHHIVRLVLKQGDKFVMNSNPDQNTGGGNIDYPKKIIEIRFQVTAQ